LFNDRAKRADNVYVPVSSALLTRLTIIVIDENVMPLPKPRITSYPYTALSIKRPPAMVENRPQPSKMRDAATIEVGASRFFFEEIPAPRNEPGQSLAVFSQCVNSEAYPEQQKTTVVADVRPLLSASLH
jgi:hypothetical protein